jgi:hypothetical protein
VECSTRFAICTALKAELFGKESEEASAFVNWFTRLYSL